MTVRRGRLIEHSVMATCSDRILGITSSQERIRSMHDLKGPLSDLVRRLDALPRDSSLIKVTNALEAAQLTVADVAPYVKETPRS